MNKLKNEKETEFINTSKSYLINLFKKLDEKLEEIQLEAYEYNRNKKNISPHENLANLHWITIEIANIKTRINDIKKKSNLQKELDKFIHYIKKYELLEE